MSDLEEIKTKLQESNKTLKEMREANDKKLTEISAQGTATAETVEQLKKTQEEYGKLQDQVKSLQKNYDKDRLIDHVKSETDGQKTERFRHIVKSSEAGDALSQKSVDFFFEQKDSGHVYSQAKVDKYLKCLEKYMKTGDAFHMAEFSTKSVNIINDVDGGFLVTPVMGELINHTIVESSPFHREVDMVTITANEIMYPRTDRRVGASRKHELAARPATSSPTEGEITIKPEDLYAAPEVSQRMLTVRPDVESWLSGIIGDEFLFAEADEIANGDGVLGARGFLTFDSGTGIDQVEQVSSGSAAAIDDMDALKDLISKIKAPYRQGAKWYMGRLTLNEILQLKDGNGQYLWQPDSIVGAPTKLLGFEVVEAEDMPAIAADSLSVMFGNLKKAYKFVQMPGVQLLRDPYSNKPFVQMHSTKRSSGNLVINEAVKVLKTEV